MPANPYEFFRLEQDGRVMASFIRTKQGDAIAAIRATFEAAGVEFTNGDEPGVKLRKPDQ